MANNRYWIIQQWRKREETSEVRDNDDNNNDKTSTVSN